MKVYKFFEPTNKTRFVANKQEEKAWEEYYNEFGYRGVYDYYPPPVYYRRPVLYNQKLRCSETYTNFIFVPK